MSSPESVLIHFDRRTRVFLGLLLLFFALATGFKLHGSSIGIWNQMSPDREAVSGVLLGRPKAIRSDEWAVTTLAIVSQARSHPSFPLANPGWGPAQVPLIFNLPVRHWSMLVRPQFWGFFVLDLERGFAFYWNMKAFLLLGGVFLLLMLLTGNDFGTSLFGTAWVFFSGFIQWWFSTPAMLPEMVGCVALLLVAVHYLLLSSRRWVIAASALSVSVCLLNSTLSLYPPFQVPLLYLGIALLVGSLIPRLAAGFPRELLGFRAGCAAFTLVAVAVLLGLYYRDAKPAISLMLGTVYPGSRMSLGGDVALAQVFSGFYGFFMSEASYPTKWGNVCEASNFVLLFPVPMANIAWRAWRSQPVTALEWSLVSYLVIVLAWMTVGGPHSLAVASALGLSPGTRPLLGLGLGSIYLCCIFLAKPRLDGSGGFGRQFLIASSFVAVLAVFALDFNRVTKGFATAEQIAIVSLVAGVAGYLLCARRRILLAVFILVPSVWSHGLVNPIAAGLGPILDTKVIYGVSEIVDRDPEARWVVYGNHVRADLIKTTGANVFNGTKVVPPLEDFRVIDPRASAEATYNRFAHIRLFPETGRGVAITLHQPDLYTIEIDPKSVLWRRLGIRYVALPFAATDVGFLAETALVLALPDVGLWVYRYE